MGNKEDETNTPVPNVHVEAPVGEWVDVPKGMVAAPNTYIDDAGVLRSTGDNSVVAWHNAGTKYGKCPVKGLKPEDLKYDANGAPWCPKCYAVHAEEREKDRLRNLFIEDQKEGQKAKEQQRRAKEK